MSGSDKHSKPAQELARTLLADAKNRLIAIAVCSTLVALVGLIPPLATARILDDILFSENNRSFYALAPYLLGVFGALAFSGILSIAASVAIASLLHGSIHTIRTRLFAHLQTVPIAFFTSTKGGDIHSRLQSDLLALQNSLARTASSLFGSALTAIFAFTAMVALSWPMAIASLLVLPVAVVLSRMVGRIRARLSDEAQNAVAQANATAFEALSVS